MTPERWQQVERIFQAALDRDASARPAFLDHACARDAELRRQVESLLGAHQTGDRFLESSALNMAARNLAAEATRPLRQRLSMLERAYVLDLLVDKRVIVEVKSVRAIDDLHVSQLLTYLRLMELPVGLLLNFNVKRMKDGIRRVVNNYRRPDGSRDAPRESPFLALALAASARRYEEIRLERSTLNGVGVREQRRHRLKFTGSQHGTALRPQPSGESGSAMLDSAGRDTDTSMRGPGTLCTWNVWSPLARGHPRHS
jgi:GxxExxY protein